jgi:16S rRNA (cytidine1402-2'-O)-methyltransferase
MYILILILHVIACVSLILIVLLQAGKGSGIAGLFGGGGSDQLFSAPSGMAFIKASGENFYEKILEGKTVALVSDAGTPGISDPGFLLVRTCLEKGIDVETLPGPTALIPALINSGLPCERFCFEGFLPPKKGRQKRLSGLEDEARTIVFYESPFRLVRTLEDLAIHFGPERGASVSRELSKIHEENKKGNLFSLAEYYKSNPPRGEIVIVVAGKRE